MAAEQLRRVLEVNLAAGDIGEREEAKILALIAAAQHRDGARAQSKAVPSAA